jgi:hypothetical protein
VSLASTAYKSFGVSASCRRSSAYLLAASMPGMMWQDTVHLSASPGCDQSRRPLPRRLSDPVSKITSPEQELT